MISGPKEEDDQIDREAGHFFSHSSEKSVYLSDAKYHLAKQGANRKKNQAERHSLR